MGTRRKMFVIVIRWPTNYVWGFLFDFYSFLIIFTNSSYRKSAEKENNHDFWYSEITDRLLCWHTYFFVGKQTTTFKFFESWNTKISNNKNTFNKLLAGENILDSLGFFGVRMIFCLKSHF